MDQQNKPKTRQLNIELNIDAPIEAVWKALTDAEELTRWFPLEAGTNPDGTMWMGWRDDFRQTSRIEISQPPHHLRTVEVDVKISGEKPAGETSQGNPMEMEPTATDFYLESAGGKTVLRLVHSGFSADAEWDEWYDATQRGWDFQLWSLKNYLEHHRGRQRHVAYVRTPIKKLSREEVWQRLFGSTMFVAKNEFKNLKSGDRYSFQTAAGDHFEGVIHAFNPPHNFSGTVENFNHGLLELHMYMLFDHPELNFQFSTYEVPKEQMEAIESRMRQLLEQLN